MFETRLQIVFFRPFVDYSSHHYHYHCPLPHFWTVPRRWKGRATLSTAEWYVGAIRPCSCPETQYCHTSLSRRSAAQKIPSSSKPCSFLLQIQHRRRSLNLCWLGHYRQEQILDDWWLFDIWNDEKREENIWEKKKKKTSHADWWDGCLYFVATCVERWFCWGTSRHCLSAWPPLRLTSAWCLECLF